MLEHLLGDGVQLFDEGGLVGRAVEGAVFELGDGVVKEIAEGGGVELACFDSCLVAVM